MFPQVRFGLEGGNPSGNFCSLDPSKEKIKGSKVKDGVCVVHQVRYGLEGGNPLKTFPVQPPRSR